MQRLIKVANYNGSLKHLAREIASLRYDKLHEFLELLANEIFEDSVKDEKRERKMLADELHKCSQHLFRASQRFINVWDIYKKNELG